MLDEKVFDGKMKVGGREEVVVSVLDTVTGCLLVK